MKIAIKKYKSSEAQVNKDDIYISLFLSVLVIGLIITNYADVLSEIVRGGISATLFSFLAKGLCGLFFIFCIGPIAKKITKAKALFIVLSITTILVNVAFFQHTQFFDTIITYCTMCLTGFLAADTLTDYSLLRRYLVITSRIVSVFVIIILLLSLTGRLTSLSSGGYRMGLGYSCVVCIMILIWNAVQRRFFYDYIGATGMLIMVILYGSRGPLVGIILFGVYFTIRYFYLKRAYIKLVFFVIAIILLLFLAQDILNFVNFGLLNKGVNSRSIRLLTTNISYDSGRKGFWNELIHEIIANPFRIRGINADYTFIGAYSHNLIIELLFEHGIIIGGAVLILIIVEFINTLSLNLSEDSSMICLIYMFASIPSLMFSGTVWTTMNFWIWLAMIIGLKKARKLQAN